MKVYNYELYVHNQVSATYIHVCTVLMIHHMYMYMYECV